MQFTVKNNFLPKNANGKFLRFTQNEWDALMSFTYNLGPKWSGLEKPTGLRLALLKENYTKAANLLLLYNKDNGRVVQGLTNRRNAERTIFLKK